MRRCVRNASRTALAAAPSSPFANATAVGPWSRGSMASDPASRAAINISRFLTTWYVTFCLRRFRRISPNSETLRPRYSETIIAVADRHSSVSSAMVSLLASVGIGYLPESRASPGRPIPSSPPALHAHAPAGALAAVLVGASVWPRRGFGLRLLVSVSTARSRRAAVGCGFDRTGQETTAPLTACRHRGAPTLADGGLVPASAWSEGEACAEWQGCHSCVVPIRWIKPRWAHAVCGGPSYSICAARSTS